jgi:hypothetical protein
LGVLPVFNHTSLLPALLASQLVQLTATVAVMLCASEMRIVEAHSLLFLLQQPLGVIMAAARSIPACAAETAQDTFFCEWLEL